MFRLENWSSSRSKCHWSLKFHILVVRNM